MPAPFDETAELLRALAHPLRLEIMTNLRSGPRCVHELVELTGATQPLISQHLRVLRAASVLVTERRGREIAYAITDTHLSHIVSDAIEHVTLEGAFHDDHRHEAHRP